jgi:TonB family protein
MSDYEQSLARRNPPTAASGVLSDSTDLDSLLSAILGDTSDGVSTLRPADGDIAATDDVSRIEAVAATDAVAQPDAVAVTDTDPEEAEYDALSPPAITQGRDFSSSSAWLDAFPSEGQADGVFQASPADDLETSASSNLAALSYRLQAVRDGESKRDRSNDILEPERNLRVVTDDSELVQEVDSKLPFFEAQPHGRFAERSADLVSIGETDRTAGETNRLVAFPLTGAGVKRKRLAKWIPLILVGVGVAVGSAFITLNALSGSLKGGEQPWASAGSITAAAQAASAPPSGTRDDAADTVPAPVSPTSSSPPAASPSELRRDVPATPPSIGETRKARVAPARSAPPPSGKPAASNDDDAIVTRPEAPSLSSAQPARSEPEPPGADTSVASAPVTTTAKPVEPPMGETIKGSLSVSEKPSAEPLAPSNAARSANATIARTAPRLLKGGTPEYPSVLRANRISGVVEVRLTIDETGRVTQAAAVSGPAPLRGAAERAVRTWVYEPATVNGVRTSATTTVSFHFDRK